MLYLSLLRYLNLFSSVRFSRQTASCVSTCPWLQSVEKEMRWSHVSVSSACKQISPHIYSKYANHRLRLLSLRLDRIPQQPFLHANLPKDESFTVCFGFLLLPHQYLGEQTYFHIEQTREEKLRLLLVVLFTHVSRFVTGSLRCVHTSASMTSSEWRT